MVKIIHVIIGEIGFVNKNNTDSYRVLQFSAFIWDNGYWNNNITCDDIFGHLKRKNYNGRMKNSLKNILKQVKPIS